MIISIIKSPRLARHWITSTIKEIQDFTKQHHRSIYRTTFLIFLSPTFLTTWKDQIEQGSLQLVILLTSAYRSWLKPSVPSDVKMIFRSRLSLLTSYLALYPMGTIFQYVLMSKGEQGDQVLELFWSVGAKYGCIERDIRYSLELLLKMKYEDCWNPKVARRNLESLVHFCAHKHLDHLR